MVVKNTLVLLLVLFLLTGSAAAQIYAPAADDSFPAIYNPPGGTDVVFVFNRPDYQSAVTASIVAVSVDKLSGWSFQWSVFDPISKGYKAIPGSGSGSSSEIDTITVASGYQVVMTKGISSQVFRLWILMNDLEVSISNKDAEDKLLFGYYNCSSLDLRADTTLVSQYYYNPDTKVRINLRINYTIRWRTDNSEATTPSNKLITRVTNPPSSDTWYIITLTDPYGISRSDSVFYESIQSEAKLAVPEYISLSDVTEYPGKNYGSFYNDNIYSAPGKFRFDLSGSRNMVGYELDFGDGEVFESEGDTLVVVHEYLKPGAYKVVLTTKSEKPYECLDSVSAEAVLYYSQFALPNVFTPNDDGDNDVISLEKSNDVFRSEDVSVVSIEIAIFDRAGLKVHDYIGAIRDWGGWDGKVRQSNRDAPEGVYFYVITALYYYKQGQNTLSQETHKGFFHLYRD
jgi:gliding motility-associated-like protein